MSGVMSRNKMPGCGKSGISRINRLISSAVIVGRPRLLGGAGAGKADPALRHRRGQIRHRILRAVVAPHLEVQIRTARASRCSHLGDLLTALDASSLTHEI